MAVVWQRFHILNRSQVFVVAAASALPIAFAVALASIPADGTSWGRFLGPSRQLDPYINFGSAFVSVLPIFVGYYHLARVGALLGLAASAVALFITQTCSELVLGLQLIGASVVRQQITYVVVWLMLSVFIFWAHLKVSDSSAVKDAQRLLRLSA
jgi:hypothetical protein